MEQKSFLVVPQPSCSYTYQSACFSPFMVVCNAGEREYRGENSHVNTSAPVLYPETHCSYNAGVPAAETDGAGHEDGVTPFQQHGLLFFLPFPLLTPFNCF